MPQPEDRDVTARIEAVKQPDDYDLTAPPAKAVLGPAWLNPPENERLGFFRVDHVIDGVEYRCPACNGASPIKGHPQNRGVGHLINCWLASAVDDAMAERCSNQHDTVGSVEPHAEFAVIMLGTTSVDALSYCCAPCLTGLMGTWIAGAEGQDEIEGWEVRRLPRAVAR